MATEVKVPTLGESITEATLGEWLKKPGDAVAADEPIAFQDRKDVIAILPLMLRHEDLDAIKEIEQPLGALAVAQDGIEGAEHAQAFRRIGRVAKAGFYVRAGEGGAVAYMDGPIKYGAVATVFWGIAGFLVGVVIAAQWGYIAPVWVGLALCVPGIAFALAGAAADRRPGARPISGHGPQRSEASGRPVLDEDSVLDGATT